MFRKFINMININKIYVCIRISLIMIVIIFKDKYGYLLKKFF